MTVSAAAVHSSPGRFEISKDVTSTADADTGMTITHGIPNFASDADAVENMKVDFEPLNSVSCALSAWSVGTRTATTVAIVKSTATGSGNGSAQVRVRISRRHGQFA